jgi:membrane fusion protein (multidrug efflux system)
MIKRMIVMLVLCTVALGSIFGFKGFVDGKIKEFMTGPNGPGRQPQTVSTAQATLSSWQPQLHAVGTLRAMNGADLSLEVAGVVEEIDFQSGDDVQAGQKLLRLRDSDDIAKLRSLEALAQWGRINYERDRKLFESKVASKSVLDNDEAQMRNNNALQAQQQVMVEKKTLKAPFAGRLGLRQVDLGQYLAPGAMVVTLQALDPIFLDFLLPQQALERLQVGQQVKAHIDTYPDKFFFGKISSINPRVDTSTRNVQIRATLQNPERKLLPGMFATAEIDIGSQEKLITLPQTAIVYNPYGNLVYVVDDKGKGPDGKPQLAVRQSFVTTGATRGDQIAVLKGVKEGDTVVTSGQMKLRNGVGIVINNSVVPKDDANPRPMDQ